MKRLLLPAVLIAACATPALAAPAAPVAPPVPTFATALTRQDLTNLREICTLAARNEKLQLEQIGSASAYCQDLLVRLGNALSTPAKAEAPASAPAPDVSKEKTHE